MRRLKKVSKENSNTVFVLYKGEKLELTPSLYSEFNEDEKIFIANEDFISHICNKSFLEDYKDDKNFDVNEDDCYAVIDATYKIEKDSIDGLGTDDDFYIFCEFLEENFKKSENDGSLKEIICENLYNDTGLFDAFDEGNLEIISFYSKNGAIYIEVLDEDCKFNPNSEDYYEWRTENDEELIKEWKDENKERERDYWNSR